MKSESLITIVKKSIKVMEEENFEVLGITTDLGSNFTKTFRVLGCEEDRPFIEIDSKVYFIYKDPPHLLKCARNYLYRGDVSVPGFSDKAKWSHIIQFHDMDSKNTLRIAPRLTDHHLTNLHRANIMKVKYAAQVCSNSVAAAMEFSVMCGLLPPDARATSSILKKFNDVFDILNSASSKDKVPLRKPFRIGSESEKFLIEALDWFKELKKINSRRCQFISGFIQSINVILALSNKLGKSNLPYLATRRLCQDPLELHFGKVRQLGKYPDAYNFTKNYARIATASLIRAPISGNCEAIGDHVVETIGHLRQVSLFISFEYIYS